MQPLHDPPVGRGGGQIDELGRTGVGRGVCEPGNAGGDGGPAHRSDIRDPSRQAGPQPLVLPPEPPGRPPQSVSLQPGRPGIAKLKGVECRAVEDPDNAAAVLNPYRPARQDGVQVPAVDQSGDGLVVADRPDPFSSGQPGVGSSQGGSQLEAVTDLRWPGGDGVGSSSQGPEVHVVVVQARGQLPSTGFQLLLAGTVGETGRHLFDAGTGNPDVTDHVRAITADPGGADEQAAMPAGFHDRPSYARPVSADPLQPLDMVAAAELIDRFGSGVAATPGTLGGCPLVLVDMDSGGEGVEITVPVSFPAVVVGLSRSGRPPSLSDSGPDVALAAVAVAGSARPNPGRELAVPWIGSVDVDSEVAWLHQRVGANPTAAATLVQVLRAGREVTVPAGLIIESLAYSTLQGGPEFGAWLASRPAPSARAQEQDPVVMSRDHARLVVTLNRPAVHNAYDAAMRDRLYEALAVAAADPTITGVDLFGAGPSFCSGGDLSEFGTLANPADAHLVRTGQSPARLLFQLADRVTAHLHGSCIGSGIELPAFAGRVLADPGTRFQLPELAMGLIPGAGGTVSVSRRIGFQRTAWLVLSGRFIDAATAEAWGLVDQVLPSGQEPATARPQ